MIALPIGVGVGVVLAAVVVGSLRVGNHAPLLLTFRALPLVLTVLTVGGGLSLVSDSKLGPLAVQFGLGGLVAVAVALVGQFIAATEDQLALRRVEGRPVRARRQGR